MKSHDELSAHACEMIAGMHRRTNMFIGNPADPRAADLLDGMFWVAHSFWAAIESREHDLRVATNVVSQKHKCSCLSFLHTFRSKHPDIDELEVVNHVLRCWAEIDACLGINIE